jgi:hypothetical protein
MGNDYLEATAHSVRREQMVTEVSIAGQSRLISALIDRIWVPDPIIAVFGKGTRKNAWLPSEWTPAMGTPCRQLGDHQSANEFVFVPNAPQVAEGDPPADRGPHGSTATGRPLSPDWTPAARVSPSCCAVAASCN